MSIECLWKVERNMNWRWTRYCRENPAKLSCVCDLIDRCDRITAAVSISIALRAESVLTQYCRGSYLRTECMKTVLPYRWTLRDNCWNVKVLSRLGVWMWATSEVLHLILSYGQTYFNCPCLQSADFVSLQTHSPIAFLPLWRLRNFLQLWYVRAG